MYRTNDGAHKMQLTLVALDVCVVAVSGMAVLPLATVQYVRAVYRLPVGVELRPLAGDW